MYNHINTRTNKNSVFVFPHIGIAYKNTSIHSSVGVDSLTLVLVDHRYLQKIMTGVLGIEKMANLVTY